jgi:GntR family transcriptional repressor for pyruvate dehydrogenase complex
MNTVVVDGVDAPATAAPISQTDVVLQGVKRMITTGVLGPGSRLPIEKDLAVSLGVSRGSLREGVRALCIMGVLETRQGDGTYVTSLDSKLLLAPMEFMVDLQAPEHRQDLHALRRVLESEAASRAALYMNAEQLARANAALDTADRLLLDKTKTDHELILESDIAFHSVIAEASDNSALAALIDALATRTVRARVWLGLHHQGQTQSAHAEHQAILRAIESRQPDRARLLMSHHLLAVEDFVTEDPPPDDDL